MRILLFGALISGVLLLLPLSCNDDNGNAPPEFATVSGTITFENTSMWPDSGEVEVTIWPQGVWTAFGPTGPPQNPNNPFMVTKVQGKTEYTYTIDGLPEGTYSAIAVGWRHPDEDLPAQCRSVVLGVYLANTDTVSTGLVIPGTAFQGPLPDSVLVAKGQTVNNLDIKADFGIIAPYTAFLQQFFGCAF